MESIDYRVGLNVDPSSQSAAASLKADLQQIFDMISKINTTPVGFRSGGGGGTSSGGGMGGGGSRAASSAASASGLGGHIPPSPVGFGGFDVDDFTMFGGTPPPADPGAKGGRSSRNGESSWANWSKISGLNAIAYGIEDMYLGGIAGAVNNVPFAVQGLSSMLGFSAQTALATAGPAALLATGGYMAYRNRESIYEDLGISLPRDQSFLGVAEKNEQQKAQKLYDDAMYYADRYGSGSAVGRGYAATAADNLYELQAKAKTEVTPDQIAAFRLMGTSETRSQAERLASLSGYAGDYRAYFESSIKNNAESMAQIRKEAEESLRGKLTYSDPIRNRLFDTEAAVSAGVKSETESFVRSRAGEKTNSVVAALSGDTSAIVRLQEEAAKSGTTPERAKEINGLLEMSKKLSGMDRADLGRLRQEAGDPYADQKRALGSIRSRLTKAGASGESLEAMMSGFENEANAARGNAMETWEEKLTQNYGRYSKNIGAALGGIELNSGNRKARAMQVGNLKNQIYFDLINSGVPEGEAAKRAEELFNSGSNVNKKLVSDAQGNPMVFMNSIDAEQQMAVQSQFAGFTQIMMARSAYRQSMLMQMTRRGIRGAR
ncbi:hypothetical protein UFOVP142_38 [uncultured Caudovirales phage]|uniref:Uncharacterized protein n=1 Tax=uncultured Caudovirales phage TaxID=2100421 RepID=A0A6J7XQC9_9CAUD|nr:hypothetical protein UFOVP142_38 [uncultured Caudovirales phage]